MSEQYAGKVSHEKLDSLLRHAAGKLHFYNVSRHSFELLRDEPRNVEINFNNYIDAIKKEAWNWGGRFFAGLPRVSDSQFLFLQDMISKMTPEGSRIGVVMSGTILWTGGAGSGESDIRKWIVEQDWLDCIVGLPKGLYSNGGIRSCLLILTNKKEAHRRGKVQLINAVDFYEKSRSSFGRKVIGSHQIEEILIRTSVKLNEEMKGFDLVLCQEYHSVDASEYDVECCMLASEVIAFLKDTQRKQYDEVVMKYMGDEERAKSALLGCIDLKLREGILALFSEEGFECGGVSFRMVYFKPVFEGEKKYICNRLSFVRGVEYSSKGGEVFDCVFIVSDREEIVRQWLQCIEIFGVKRGNIEYSSAVGSGDKLLEAVKQRKFIIVTTIQRFLTIPGAIPNASESRYAVIIDEAYRSQRGEMALHMRKALSLSEAEKFDEGQGVAEPFLHTAYIDKPLSDMRVFQVLGRLGRVCRGKYNTGAIDFINDVEKIRQNFLSYYGDDWGKIGEKEFVPLEEIGDEVEVGGDAGGKVGGDLLSILKNLMESFGFVLTNEDEIECLKLEREVCQNGEVMKFFNGNNHKDDVQDMFYEAVDDEILELAGKKLELYNKLSDRKFNDAFKRLWFNKIYDRLVRGV